MSGFGTGTADLVDARAATRRSASPAKFSSRSVPADKSIGVVIVEDDSRVRLRLEEIIEQSQKFRCVGSCSAGMQALSEIANLRPQILLIDLGTEGVSVVECIHRLRTDLPELCVIALSSRLDWDWVCEALDGGADGYLIKPFSKVHCLALLRVTYWRTRSRNWHDEGFVSSPATPSLPGREQAIAELVALGLSDKEIAVGLNLSVFVVGKFIRVVRNKIGAKNRAGVAAWIVKSNRSVCRERLVTDFL